MAVMATVAVNWILLFMFETVVSSNFWNEVILIKNMQMERCVLEKLISDTKNSNYILLGKYEN